ncbi:MAG: ferrous iron transporter B, partial [Clostridia bacterium]|nr:ferrous iron transporter B [Clostridia bacterium]
WMLGGILLQLSVGFTVSYAVYTIGTLIASPEALNVTVALAGLAAVAVIVGVVTALCIRSELKLKRESLLKK